MNLHFACKAFAVGTFNANVVDKKDWRKLMNSKTMMSDDELFLDMESGEKAPARKGKGRGKKTVNDLFAELKVKMVMRIYGVSRTRALEIIAGRADEKLDAERSKERETRQGKRDSDDDDDGMVSAAEFFGMD